MGFLPSSFSILLSEKSGFDLIYEILDGKI
jgi:hypothetical protein